MQKQKKILMKLKNKVVFKKNAKRVFIFKKICKTLNVFRLKKFIPSKLNAIKKVYTFLLNKKVSNSLAYNRGFSKKITFRFSQNNIFCNLLDLKKNKTLHTSSAGIYKIKLSKRKIKAFYKTFVYIFFNKINKNIIDFKNTFFNIIAPIKIRKSLIKIIISEIKKCKPKHFEQKNILINILAKKCFNGCRAKKKIRKKGRFSKIYK
jgi:hypothetical protein